MLAHRLQVAQEALQGVAGIDGVGAVAGPQHFHRLARLAHGEGVLRAEAQLGLQVRHLVPLRELLERHGGAAHQGDSRIDETARLGDPDLHRLEIGDFRAGVSAKAGLERVDHVLESAFRRA